MKNLRLRLYVCMALVGCLLPLGAWSEEAPKLVAKDGRHALLVDGKPYLMLGAQINNSSAWPQVLPDVWPTLEAMHVNTVEAPVYWEQMEPKEGTFDWTLVDAVVKGAREHKLRAVLLWFGTWKNGEMHYAPEWVKADHRRFQRMINERGEPVQVLSANSTANLDADRRAFVALMRHLKEIDGTEHTVLMMQVENESGGINAVRDHSAEAEKQFAAGVPAALSKALHVGTGGWGKVFGPDADETFQAYSQAAYINAIAAAGKKEFDLPMYCNVWVRYPRGYQIRGYAVPGYDYPSGGAVQAMVPLWKAVAPSIDVLAPDVYSNDRGFMRELMATYARPDNALLVPEAGHGDEYATAMFYALGKGAIGFAPFGVDATWGAPAGPVPGPPPAAHAANFALVTPIAPQVALANYEGRLQTAVEEEGKPEEMLHFGRWDALVGFGRGQKDASAHAPGTKSHEGRAIVVQLGPDEFLVTGIEARVTFYLKPGEKGFGEITRAEEGSYDAEGQWTMRRIWNGDQTDRGLNFPEGRAVVRIKLAMY